MRKKIINILGILTAVFLACIINHPVYVYASTGEGYITISVDASDNNGSLLYALDTDDPSAFGTSNEFSVPAGTDHTIYVKDAAGNITSQEFKSSETDANSAYTVEKEENGQNVNIDVFLDNKTPDQSNYEYAGVLSKTPAEEGQGTVYDKVSAPVNDLNAERIFYTVTTDEGEVFYLVIDQGENSDNVYFLNKVTVSDLDALAADDKSVSEETESLLSSLNNQSSEMSVEDTLTDNESGKKSTGTSNNSKMIIVLLVVVVGGGIYYYQNIYKKKKDEQMDLVDAPDREDFAVEEEEEDEDADFGLDEDYQEQTMARLLEDDDYEQNDEDIDEEEKYATSHISDASDEEGQASDDVVVPDEFDEDLDAPDEDEEEDEE